MRYIIYWELNPDVNFKDIAKAAAKLTQEKKYPLPGQKILGWYITSSVPIWGVSVIEYEGDNCERDIYKSLMTWLNEVPNVFKSYKIAPYLSIDEAIKVALEI